MQLRHLVILDKSTSRFDLLRWTIIYSVFNSVVLAFISLRYISYMDPVSGWLAIVYWPMALIGNISLLSAVATLFLLLPLLLLFNNRYLSQWCALILAIGATLLLLLDSEVYSLYRFHLSGFIFSLVFDGAGGEIFTISAKEISIISIIIVLVIITQFVLAALAKKLLGQRIGRRLIYAAWIMGLWLMLASHAIHVWADANYYQPVTQVTRHLPFYYPSTAKRYLERKGWADLAKNRAARQLPGVKQAGSSAMNYPQAPLSCAADINKKNLLFIVIDSWRFDALDKNITPNITRFSKLKGTQNFRQHFSGGNGTQSGVFSLFYGIPSTYWTAVNSSQISPVLMDKIISLNYQVGVFASAKLTSPAFDRTIFSRIADLRLSSDGDQAWQRDQDIVLDWEEFLNDNHDQPFFGFLFFDAPHGLSYPGDYFEPFTPVWRSVNHLQLNNNFDPAPYLNKYKNAVHYTDTLVGRVLKDLESRQLMDNTVIIITSDHGEEFNDNRKNYWGHSSNFTRYQTQVPLLIYWPGGTAAVFVHKTMHSDIVPTIMHTLFLCDNALSDYSSGRLLVDATPRGPQIIGSYFNYAIVEKERMTVIFPTGNYKIVDLQDQKIVDAKLNPAAGVYAIQEMSRFFK